MAIVAFSYVDFDGLTRDASAEVHENRAGFYVQNLDSFGCSKTMCPAVHWKPIRAAIVDLLGGRQLVSYAVQ